ncbi:MAG TPA: hypothetical protein VM782_15305 [Stellaceae bacterium]|nr:hypothetical protein [Stellaceae bacterium]
MARFKNWIALAIAAVVVVVIIAVSATNWRVIGASDIDLNGWIALILGVIVTLALGIGLMALIFISNRRGYDDPPDKQY